MRTLKDLVTASRAAVRAHVQLRRAYVDEASERVKKARQLELRRALDRLTDTVISFERELARVRSMPKASRPGFDWAGFFRASLGMLEIVRTAMSSEDGARTKVPVDFIDAEVISDDSA